ncbi:RUB1 conjugating enzyme [Cardiosporidium cionae]|uniref:RUB1 conjugating enzyme n=1 Tax=Cardiosporidium cionae TaxID=476202 RepID=A0ABQ7J4C7_9APIC|nr:RUB1 conjugating enzyme [Cardiosporidium cionae]|eukprot:KAF8817940.1 RUB1 conjugating enzyme [Cardiosporidium cionae]
MLRFHGLGRGKPVRQPEGSSGTARKAPAEIRVQKDLDNIDLPPNSSISFEDRAKILEFKISLLPDEGFWQGANFLFDFTIPYSYPHDPPKVKCSTKIFHPNIDLQGNICLNVLRQDWKPVLSISTIVFGLLHLLLEPNTDDPLNPQAAEVLRLNQAEFSRLVRSSLRGETIRGESFPRLI